MSILRLFQPRGTDDFPVGARNLYPDEWVSAQQLQQLAARVVRIEKHVGIYEFSQARHNDPDA